MAVYSTYLSITVAPLAAVRLSEVAWAGNPATFIRAQRPNCPQMECFAALRNADVGTNR